MANYWREQTPSIALAIASGTRIQQCHAAGGQLRMTQPAPDGLPMQILPTTKKLKPECKMEILWPSDLRP